MQMMEEDNAGRTKRGLVPGGQFKPKKQMVEVERIYKGQNMMMPMMKLDDSFSAATKIETTVQLGKVLYPNKLAVEKRLNNT
jgi:hypothetical protein